MGIVTLIIIFILTVFIVVTGFLKRRLSYWRRKGVPTVKTHFLWGNAQSVINEEDSIGNSIQKLTEHFKKQQVPFYGYYFSFQPIFVAVDTELITKILVSDFEHFTDRPLFNHESDPLSSHLFAAKGLKWKHLRAKLAPAFTISKSKMMLSTMKICLDNLLDILSISSAKSETVDMKDLGTRLSLDILASCSFGLDSNALKNSDSDFKYYATAFFDTSVKDTIVRICMFLFPNLLLKLKIKSIREDITQFFIGTVDNTIKYREANNVIRKDLMHLLLQIKNNVDIVDEEVGDIRNNKNKKDSLTVEEVAAQCFVFFVAGYESSSSALSFCLYELSLNKVLQDKARKEIVTAVNNRNGKVDYDLITNLPFLEKCVKETLRKYPLLPFLFRSCTKNYPIPGSDVIVEKDTICFIPTSILHRDPEVYPNPDEFDPERFSEENVTKRHSLNWIPFGYGPRICIAYQFGLTQVKFTLSTLLLNYEFFLNPKTKVPIVLDNRTLQTRAKDGIWLDVKKIK